MGIFVWRQKKIMKRARITIYWVSNEFSLSEWIKASSVVWILPVNNIPIFIRLRFDNSQVLVFEDVRFDGDRIDVIELMDLG